MLEYSDVILNEAKKYQNVLERFRLEHTRKTLENLDIGELVMIGVTGTKGKTTTTHILRDILRQAGQKVTLCGTMGAYIDDEYIELKNTTPGIDELADIINKSKEKGVRYFVMEVSSQGLKQCRVAGIRFDYGVFTNLSRDHIGGFEHENMEEYIFCKSLLFANSDVTVMNSRADCKKELLKWAKDKVYFYHSPEIGESIEKEKNNVILTGQILSCDEMGTEFAVMANKGGYNGLIRFPLLGRFNVENCLAAMMVAHFEGIDFSYVTKALEKFFVCGREEKICLENGAVVLIDYAHNAASIESILRDVSLYHFKRIISLFGCGGNRSSGRRESMGEVSGRYADLSIITEDNSRFEDTDNIIEDIVKGVLKSSGKYVIIKDRRKAIEYSLEISRKGDIILLLGKGHERYQEKNGVREPFSEREIVENYRMEK